MLVLYFSARPLYYVLDEYAVTNNELPVQRKLYVYRLVMIFGTGLKVLNIIIILPTLF